MIAQRKPAWRYANPLRILGIIVGLLIIVSSGSCSDNSKYEISRCNVGDAIKSGEYILVNNAGEDYQQCIFTDTRSQSFGWTWIPPTEQSSKTSPYICFGECSGENTTPELPARIAKINTLSIDYDAAIFTTDPYSFAFELLLRPYPEDQANPDQVLIIGVDSFTPNSAAQLIKRVTLAGDAYDLYGISALGNWEYLALVKVNSQSSGTVNVYALLKILKKEKEISLFETLYSIKFINEVEGEEPGQTTLFTYSIIVDSVLSRNYSAHESHE